MKLRKNDEVIVIAGNHKGEKGKILEVLKKQNRVRVAGVNIVKKHVKPTQQNPDGGIKEQEGSIHVSNVALFIKGKNGGPSKIAYKYENDKKQRIAKKTQKVV